MIGIFDSGSGGLTVMRAVRDVLPSSDIVYFGDTAHAPYGERPHEELSRLTVEALRTLQRRGAERIISACNSVSASLAVSLFDACSLLPDHLIEMVGPTVAYFRGTDARIVVCATPATVRAGLYQSAFRMIGVRAECVPMPGLAGAIEFGAPEAKMRDIIKRALSGVSADVLILACTHYPLVQELFQEIAGGRMALFNPALAVAERARERFWPQEVGDAKTSFLISRDSAQFRARVAALFPESAHDIEVVA